MNHSIKRENNIAYLDDYREKNKEAMRDIREACDLICERYNVNPAQMLQSDELMREFAMWVIMTDGVSEGVLRLSEAIDSLVHRLLTHPAVKRLVDMSENCGYPYDVYAN